MNSRPSSRSRMSPVLLVAGLALVLVVAAVVLTRQGSPAVAPSVTLRTIDLVASVDAINVDLGWSQEGGITRGAMRLSLDDLRTLTIMEGTMVDSYETIPACTELSSPNACVLLADMLGEAVVWFALVPADKVSGREILTMPGLVDMRANGDEGIMRNGWVVTLATPVVRDCDKQDTANLRDFITRFPDADSLSIMDLMTDSVIRVRCR